MVDFHHAGMLKVLMYFQLPSDVEGDVDGLSADGDGRGNVAFQGVAHHNHFVGFDTEVTAQL